MNKIGIVLNETNKLNCPCKSCIDKFPKCHAFCEKYLEFRNTLNELKRTSKQEKYKRDGFVFYEKDGKIL